MNTTQWGLETTSALRLANPNYRHVATVITLGGRIDPPAMRPPGAPPTHALVVASEEARSRFSGTNLLAMNVDAESCEYQTGDDDLAWLGLRIAMLGVDFTVQEPPELAEPLRRLADRLTRAAAGVEPSSLGRVNSGGAALPDRRADERLVT